ncbi:MAG TPA: ABC transporter substrate-binding protein [Stellaceae bacterium]|nr:ABC transporter substrate-binding protein [Stellaceae bacterium]
MNSAFLACVGLAALIAGASPAAALDRVKIAVVSSLSSAPAFVANAKGYFRNEGLDVDLVHFDSAAPIAVAVASGDVDFASAGLAAAFFTLANQGVLKIIGSGNGEHKGFQGIGYILSNRAYDAGIRRFEDLKGRSVAITQLGSALQYSLDLVLRKHGVDMKDVRLLPLQSNQNVASAIAGGQADAAVQSGPNIYALVNKGNARLLAWYSDELSQSPGDATYTSAKLANARPETVKHFMAAFRKGAATWDAAFLDAAGNRVDQPSAPEMIAIAAKGLDQPEAVIRLGLTWFDPQLRIAVADIQGSLDWYYQQGMLKTPMNARSMIDFRYAIEEK